MVPVYSDLVSARSAPAKCLAIGFFDGLHLGHRQVIVGDRSPADVSQTVVFTFDPHPAAVLRPGEAPPLLTGIPHKLSILNQWGIGGIIRFPFNLERSRQPADAFLDEVIQSLPWVTEIRVGQRWRFGHQRMGDVNLVQAMAGARNIATKIIPDVESEQTIISSSRIRILIQKGDLPAAARLLGRPFRILGTVIPGQKVGSSLGFPTANLQTEDQCLPPLGVYAGWTHTARGPHPSVMNFGHRPTVSGGTRSLHLESHLLDFSENLYNHTVAFEPVQFLRPEERFESVAALREAVERDIAKARTWAASRPAVGESAL